MEKKRNIIIYSILASMLFGCSNKNYHINQNSIIKISGTEQISDDFKNVVLSKEGIEKFTHCIDALSLVKTNKISQAEGMDFFFVIDYEDGSQEIISISNEEICINRYIYKTNSYNQNDFICFFN